MSKAYMLSIKVNGRPYALQQPIGLNNFLCTHGIHAEQVAVGYNGEILDRGQFESVVLKEGDILEIVKPVGGG